MKQRLILLTTRTWTISYLHWSIYQVRYVIVYLHVPGVDERPETMDFR